MDKKRTNEQHDKNEERRGPNPQKVEARRASARRVGTRRVGPGGVVAQRASARRVGPEGWAEEGKKARNFGRGPAEGVLVEGGPGRRVPGRGSGGAGSGEEVLRWRVRRREGPAEEMKKIILTIKMNLLKKKQTMCRNPKNFERRKEKITKKKNEKMMEMKKEKNQRNHKKSKNQKIPKKNAKTEQ